MSLPAYLLHLHQKVCLDEAGSMTLTSPQALITATYPDSPQTFLEIYSNGTEANGTVVWQLDWMNEDPTSGLAWSAVPSRGMTYPGETIKVNSTA